VRAVGGNREVVDDLTGDVERFVDRESAFDCYRARSRISRTIAAVG
jgi:hypothetical protein